MRSLLRRIHRRLARPAPQPAIVLYHRVAAPPFDPWRIAVRPDVFEAQVAFLAADRTILALTEFVTRLADGTLPRDAVAITFDDGYGDNLHAAKPVLDAHRAAATLFLTTRALEAPQDAFWWEELERMTLQEPRAAAAEVEVAGQTVRVEWGQMTEGEGSGAWLGWEAPQTARQAAYQQLWRLLHELDDEAMRAGLAALRRALPGSQSSIPAPLSRTELDALLADGAWTLGAHGVSHCALTKLPAAAVRDELERSRSDCQALGAQPVEAFAYPHGDFDAAVADAAQAAGYAFACTTEDRAIAPADADRLFELPRITARNERMDDFAARLSSA